MSWTIFDGFNRNGEYSEQLAVAYQADLDLQAGLRKVEVDVRTALVSLERELSKSDEYIDNKRPPGNREAAWEWYHYLAEGRGGSRSLELKGFPGRGGSPRWRCRAEWRRSRR